MTTNLDTNQLLEAILNQLQATKQTLGFGHPPKSRYVYANRKYPNCLWYFWNGATNEHEPIEFHALTGIFESLEIEEKEYKGKPDLKVNLHISADRPYVVQAGYDTLFAKSLLYTISRLPTPALAQPITLAVEPGDTEQVLFCRLYNPVTQKSAFVSYPENTNWHEATQRAIAKLDLAHNRTPQTTSIA